MKEIRLEKLKSKKPTNKTRITAFLILFLLIGLVFYTIKKYGQGFLTFLIFILLLLIPVFIIFEEDIVSIFGYKYEKKPNKIKTKKKTKSKSYKMLTSKTAKQIITISLVILSIIVSIVLLHKSRKLDQSIPVNKRKILLFLIISQLLMINSGTLAMVYL